MDNNTIPNLMLPDEEPTPTAAPAAEAPAEEKKAPAKKAPAKKAKPAGITIRLTKSFSGRLDVQIATAKSLGLRKIGDVTVQPDNAATRGKVQKIVHLVAVEED